LRTAGRSRVPGWVPSSFLLRRSRGARCRVGGLCGADELLERDLVDRLPLSEIDRTSCVPFEAGVEQLLWVFDGGAAKEGELHDLLVRFPCAHAAVMGPDRNPARAGLRPLPLLLDVGVRFVDEPTETSE